MEISAVYLRPVRGCIKVGCVLAALAACCLGLLTLVLLLANSSLMVCGMSGSNLTPCCKIGHKKSDIGEYVIISLWGNTVKVKGQTSCNRSKYWAEIYRLRCTTVVVNFSNCDVQSIYIIYLFIYLLYLYGTVTCLNSKIYIYK